MRTGLGGQKVVINGGAFVMPIFHDVTPVFMRTHRMVVQCVRDRALISQGPDARRRHRRVLRARRADQGRRFRRGADARPPQHGHRSAARTGRGPFRRYSALGRGGNDDGRTARAAQRICAPRAGVGGRAAGQERPGSRGGIADQPRPDQYGVLQPLERLRRGRSDPAYRADRTAQEAPQRHRAGHADRDPQEEPRNRTARPRYRPRCAICAPRPGARDRHAAGGAALRTCPPACRARAGDPSKRRFRCAKASSAPASRRSWRSSSSASAARSNCSGWRWSGGQSLELAEQKRIDFRRRTCTPPA